MVYKLTENDDGTSPSYGVALYMSGGAVRRIDCVSDCRRDVEELAELLNSLEIEPCHFEDVIEDYLTDFRVT